MSRKIEVFKDQEMNSCYYIQNAPTIVEAWEGAVQEYPEITEIFTVDDMEVDVMNKCLDCQSYWISDDVCGECGEQRLSKRNIPVYKLEKI